MTTTDIMAYLNAIAVCIDKDYDSVFPMFEYASCMAIRNKDSDALYAVYALSRSYIENNWELYSSVQYPYISMMLKRGEEVARNHHVQSTNVKAFVNDGWK